MMTVFCDPTNLNVQVAMHVLGWKISKPLPGTERWCHERWSVPNDVGWYTTTYKDRPPNYSGDIVEATKLLDRFKEKHSFVIGNNDEGKYFCVIGPAEGFSDRRGQGESESMAEAICLACVDRAMAEKERAERLA